MDKNLLKAIILSFIVLIIWDRMGFLGRPVNKKAQGGRVIEKTIFPTKETRISPPENKTPSLPEKSSITLPETDFSEKTVNLIAPSIDIEISNRGGRIKKAFLKKYNETLYFNDSFFSPLSLLRIGNIGGIDNKEFQIQGSDEPGVINLKCKLSDDVEISGFLNTTIKDYLYKYKVIVKNTGKTDIFFRDGLEIGTGSLALQEKKTYPLLAFSRFTIESKPEYFLYKTINGKQSLDETFFWAGVQNTSYCLIISESDSLRQTTWFHENNSKQISLSISTHDFSLASGQEKIFTFNYYIGPKLYFHLKSLGLAFENIIDYGSVLGPITKPLVLFLNFLFKVTGNYGLAIIIMTICFRIATYPLTIKSMVSMKAMQKLQPHIKQLQVQYKNNQALLQKEMLALYKKHGVNPMSGCLPMLIQLPIFIAFYKAIANSVELQGASFLFIRDLAAPDRIITIGAFSLNILPLLMGVVQFFSSKQTTTDPSQKHLIYFFPVFMVVIFYSMPSALVLYFLVSTLIGIVQTWLIKMPEKN